MFCAACGDVVSPGLKDLNPRWCDCGRHACWWLDATVGQLRVHDSVGANSMAHVLGLHNGALVTAVQNWPLTPELVEIILDETPATYLFKQQGSLVVRFKPGDTGDTAWATHLP